MRARTHACTHARTHTVDKEEGGKEEEGALSKTLSAGPVLATTNTSHSIARSPNGKKEKKRTGRGALANAERRQLFFKKRHGT